MLLGLAYATNCGLWGDMGFMLPVLLSMWRFCNPRERNVVMFFVVAVLSSTDRHGGKRTFVRLKFGAGWKRRAWILVLLVVAALVGVNVGGVVDVHYNGINAEGGGKLRRHSQAVCPCVLWHVHCDSNSSELSAKSDKYITGTYIANHRQQARASEIFGDCSS